MAMSGGSWERASVRVLLAVPGVWGQVMEKSEMKTNCFCWRADQYR